MFYVTVRKKLSYQLKRTLISFPLKHIFYVRENSDVKYRWRPCHILVQLKFLADMYYAHPS